MACNFLPSPKDHSDEEDYRDIEPLPPQNREFEFQMASITNDKKTTTSHADELFYRGKLLPLHQKLLQAELKFQEDLEEEEESFCINFLITPIGSCNISPSQSCRESFELNSNEHLFEWSSTELTTSSSIANSPKKVWSNKLNLIKDSLICQKFKASRAFLKSLFSKSSCSNGNSCSTAEIKWRSPTKCLFFSSSNCSFNSSNNSFYELNFLKRSNSFTSDIEAAVAHCKKSQELTIPSSN
ncbi:probable membrane-associated kinase regulator 4 [Lycium ferocissimum]|uniref:probable membrane-associated kinase regulator 4 n=1 Tax=Lycium ferocissimum TaxID=112874 RepID=UPI002815F553|nr:probable membrane-associated kinase regulator 4 [Lycium ferocissimum]